MDSANRTRGPLCAKGASIARPTWCAWPDRSIGRPTGCSVTAMHALPDSTAADCQESGSAPEPYTRYSSMGYLYLLILQALQLLETLHAWQVPCSEEYRRMY